MCAKSVKGDYAEERFGTKEECERQHQRLDAAVKEPRDDRAGLFTWSFLLDANCVCL